MRRLRYSVAASLDGYIAGPQGDYDWIIIDPEIDFGALMSQFGVVVMGRRSYAVAQAVEDGFAHGLPTFVYSRTLPEGEAGGVTVVRDGIPHVRGLKAGDGKDIWLWGGGDLFRSCAEAGLVDAVDVAVIPILLGGGIPLFPPSATRLPLHLRSHRVYAGSGTVMLEYDVAG